MRNGEKQAGVYLLVSIRNVGSVSPLLSDTEIVCASSRLQRSQRRKDLGLSASQLTLMPFRPKKFFYHGYKVQILPGLSVGNELALHFSSCQYTTQGPPFALS